MKKSERNKIKIGVIRKLKLNLDFSKRLLKRDWRNRYSGKLLETRYIYRVAIKTDFEYIHRHLFALRAAEKQIPMPVRIKTSLRGDFPGWWNADGTYHVSVHYDAYCQNCGGKVECGVKGMGAYEHDADWRYCQYCGQKLWWPKN